MKIRIGILALGVVMSAPLTAMQYHAMSAASGGCTPAPAPVNTAQSEAARKKVEAVQKEVDTLESLPQHYQYLPAFSDMKMKAQARLDTAKAELSGKQLEA